jgi:hypothetical protein
MNNTTNNQNVLPSFKTPKIFIPIILIIFFFIILLFFVLYKIKLNNHIITIIFSVLLGFILFVFLIPNLKNIFQQISSVTYVIIYTISLILFFQFMPKNIVNDYAFIFLPITIILGIFTFYKSFSYSYIDQFNINYERIKIMILFFCLITTFIVYYINDPGGYITSYFGYSSFLTILIGIFAFLYLLIILTLPDNVNNSTNSNFLSNFSSISVFGGLAFLIFIIVITALLYTYPGGFLNAGDITYTSIIIILIICILWSFLLVSNLFSDVLNNQGSSNKLNLIKRSLLMLFSIVISGLIIAWIAYAVQNYSGKTSLTSLILNIALIVLILGLIYKVLIVKLPVGNSNKNAFFTLILNILLYIPCLFSSIFDNFSKFAFGKENSNTFSNLLMLVLTFIIIIIYFTTPNVFNLINIQGGNQLINEPIKLNSLTSLGTYEKLNESSDYDYQYALSFWFYIDSSPRNLSSSTDKNLSILNYGNKPNVLYDVKNNSLLVTIQQKDLKDITQNKLIDFDDNGNRILYKNSNVLLQKWNNMILNYTGGILDVFLNGELVKSNVGVVPYYKLDNLTTGEENGLDGGICNVVYFKKPLTSTNIFYIYNLVKKQNPPVLENSKKTILHDNINTSNTSVKDVL